MKVVINLLAASVRRRPIITLVAVLIGTMFVASFSSQIVMADADEGFAPDAEELTASEEIGELFGEESSNVVLQVIVSTDGGDVISADGLDAVQQLTEAIQSSDLADDLQEQEGVGSVVSFLAPLQGQPDAGPSVRIIVSGEDVISQEGLAAVSAVQEALSSSPAAAKLDVSGEQGPIVSFMAPLQAQPGQGPALQVVVDAGEGDVFTAEGLQTSMAVQQAVFSSSLAPKLVADPNQPPFTTYLLPVDFAIAQGQLPPDAPTEAIKRTYVQGQAALPPDVAGFLPFLVSNDADLEAVTARKGLITVNLGEPATPQEIAEVAAAVAGLGTPLDARVLDPTATGASFKALYADRLSFLPPEVAPFIDFLLSNDRDRLANTASKGMIVANLTEPLTEIEEQGLAASLSSVDVPGMSLTYTPANPTDEQVKEGFRDGLAFIPAEQVGVVENLLGSDRDMAGPRASNGLMLVFLTDAPPDEQEEFGIRQQEMVDELSLLDLPDGFEAKAFSFGLIFASGGDATDEIARMFGLAGAIILVILLFNFWFKARIGVAARRTLADTILTLVTIFLAIGFMQGAGVLLGPKYLGVIGDFNQIVQILPILLIGLGVDYGIHMTFRYREEVGHNSVDDSIQIAIKTVGVALVLATVTTAVGFLTNLVSPVPALKDFGILAAVGIVASFVLMLTFVPAVRELLDRRAERAGRLPKAELGTVGASASAAGASAAGLIGGLGVYLVSVLLEARISGGAFADGFEPVSAVLFGAIGAGVGFVLVYLPRIVGPTSKLAEKAALAVVIVALVLAGLGEFGRQQLVTEFSFTDFVPTDNPLLETLDLLTEEFGGGLGETTNVLVKGDVTSPEIHNAQVAALENLADTPDVVLFGEAASAQSVLSVVANLVNPQSPAFNEEVAAAAAASGLGPDLRVPAGADVAGLYAAVEAADPEGFGAVVQENASLWSISTQAGDLGAEALNTNIRSAFAPVVEQGASAVPTSNDIIGNVVVLSLQDSQLQSLVITLAAATLLLVINFWVESRRPLLGIITMLPVGLVVLLTFGMMALTDIPFGPVTATISALAIGIGVPYTIHITHRFQEDIERYATPEEAVRSTALHTGGALAGSAMTTMAGFGSLVTSNLTPFRQFGAVTFYAIGFALLMALLVLPSMLVLWARWHARRGDSVSAEGPGVSPAEL